MLRNAGKRIFNLLKSSGSLQKRIFIFFFTLMVFMASVISFSTYFVYKGLMVEKIGSSRVDVLKQIGERTRVIKNSALAVSNLYYYDEAINNAVSNESDKRVINQELADSLSGIASKYELAFEKSNISFYSIINAKNGFKFASNGNGYDFSRIEQQLWYNNIIKNSGNIFWVTSYEDLNNKANSNYVFSAARIFMDRTTGKNTGILLINIDERSLYNTYKNVLDSNNSIYIVDEKGSIVSHKDENMLGINFFDMQRFGEIFRESDHKIIKKGDDKFLFSKYLDPETQWTIVEEIPMQELMTPLKKVQYVIIGIFTLCTLLSLVLSIFFSRSTAYPLKVFCRSMERVRHGDLDVISDIKGWEEIKQISDGFNQMIEKIKALLNSIKEKEKLKRKAELDFLQAQINPHFLYNTLFSIKCMISMNQNSNAEDMMTAFIDLLKKTLNNKDELIAISDEIEILNKYITIQSYRYSNKFDIVFDVESTILESRIPKLILQPLVENAIFHGIEPKRGKGVIRIQGLKVKSDILIKVIDDGVGIEKKRIKALWKMDPDVKERKFNQVGIINVHQRIQMNFGMRYGIKIYSTLGKGTEIHVRLPVVC